jgi:2-isopropylmalate synthase
VVLESYRISAITGGTDAQGEVHVRVSINGRAVMGRGANVNIIEASALAYINALNKLAKLYPELIEV